MDHRLARSPRATLPEDNLVPKSFVDAMLSRIHVKTDQLILRPAVTGEIQAFFSIIELAKRWRCSRGTVYNRLRIAGASWMNFGKRGKRSKKSVPTDIVMRIERKYLRRAN